MHLLQKITSKSLSLTQPEGLSSLTRSPLIHLHSEQQLPLSTINPSTKWEPLTENLHQCSKAPVATDKDSLQKGTRGRGPSNNWANTDGVRKFLSLHMQVRASLHTLKKGLKGAGVKLKALENRICWITTPSTASFTWWVHKASLPWRLQKAEWSGSSQNHSVLTRRQCFLKPNISAETSFLLYYPFSKLRFSLPAQLSSPNLKRLSYLHLGSLFLFLLFLLMWNSSLSWNHPSTVSL